MASVYRSIAVSSEAGKSAPDMIARRARVDFVEESVTHVFFYGSYLTVRGEVSRKVTCDSAGMTTSLLPVSAEPAPPAPAPARPPIRAPLPPPARPPIRAPRPAPPPVRVAVRLPLPLATSS